MARRLSDHRPHVGQARAQAEPRRLLDRLPKREQPPGKILVAVNLDHIGRGLRIGELDTSRQPDAPRHGRQHVAALFIHNGV
jgi:hypothetical protein